MHLNIHYVTCVGQLQVNPPKGDKHKAIRKRNSYVDRDVHSEMFPDANKIRDTLADCYHTLANLVTDVRHLTLNKEGTGQHWKLKRREFEQEHGRFVDVGTLAPWHITNSDDLYELSKTLKCPKDWPDISRLIHSLSPYLSVH
jgi:hypothetical protein